MLDTAAKMDYNEEKQEAIAMAGQEKKTKNPVVLITGGSSGIGAATAAALLAHGCTVYEVSRHPAEDGASGPIHLTGDVTDPDSLTAAVDALLAREGRLDILINNAGFGISGSAEHTAPADAERQLAVNFLGCAAMCRACLPALRQSRGRIVNLSSVAAVVPIPFQAFYSASKAAINAFTLALLGEVRPFGVSVCAVMPGDIRTGFTAARKKSAAGDDVYGGRIARSVGKMEHDEQNGMSADAAGAAVAHIALRRRVKPLYAIRADYRLVCVLARLLPSALLCRITGALYGGR